MSTRLVPRGRGPLFVVLVALASGLLATPAFAQHRRWSVEGDLAADGLGASVTYVPDVDGDGVVDLLVGGPGEYGGLVGKAILYSGATKTAIREFDGDSVSDQFGSIVVDLGDVDGDGARDFAIAAPWRNSTGDVPGAPLGAIEVFSGNGPRIRTITSSSSTGQVGLAMTWLGDVDGDGVRDLLYNDETSPDVYKVFVVSGKTGATIRTHTDSTPHFGGVVGRVGDVDGDAVDDYVIGYAFNDEPVYHFGVYSGATGNLIRTIDLFATSVASAGDVDLDGRADLLLYDGYGTIQVVSGATGLVLYSLTSDVDWGGDPVGFRSMSATGDLNGDGRPDLVGGELSAVDVYSGADGSKIASYPFSAWALDATADVDGDGIADLLTGNPLVQSDQNAFAGEVVLVSGANGSSLATIEGQGVLSELGCASTLVGDRDGDGWQDVAVVVPNGLLDSDPSLVVVLSGQDGHELSRFQTTNAVDFHDREIVAVGDVDGDGVGDVAVACPGTEFVPTNTVEVRSGADNSLIETLTTADHLFEIGAAADVDGTPLLAVTTGVFRPEEQVDVYDLTTGSIVATCAGHGAHDVGCVGDVDGDGKVDWLVRSFAGFGDATVFSGATGAVIWHLNGSILQVDSVARAGDLNGDGLDDVLVGNTADVQSKGSVTAVSGAKGAKLFKVSGTKRNSGFGSSVASLGDVNRDGVDDFAVLADPKKGAPDGGSIHVYSGATGGLLYRFDSTNSNGFPFATMANLRRGDDGRVGPDKSADLVVGVSWSGGLRGLAELFELDDLMLQVDPPNPKVGDSVTATTSGGPSGNLVGLYLLDVSGVPLDYYFALGTFDSKGSFAVTDRVPSSMQGLTLDVISYGVGFNGKLADSQETAIEVQ